MGQEVSDEQGWIGVDLDRTLAEYHGWEGASHIGKPIPMMRARVIQWLGQGMRVKIMTARVSRAADGYSIKEIASLIQDWCEEHIGQRLEVTNVKDYAMIELWDDRAIRVEVDGKRYDTRDIHKTGIDTLKVVIVTMKEKKT